MIWRRHVHEEGRRWNPPLPLQRRKCLPRALNHEGFAFSRPGSAARCKQWGSSCISTAHAIWRMHVHEEGRRWDPLMPLQRRKCLPHALNRRGVASSGPGSAMRAGHGANQASCPRLHAPGHAFGAPPNFTWGGRAFRPRRVPQRWPCQARVPGRCYMHGSSCWEVWLGRRSRIGRCPGQGAPVAARGAPPSAGAGALGGPSWH